MEQYLYLTVILTATQNQQAKSLKSTCLIFVSLLFPLAVAFLNFQCQFFYMSYIFQYFYQYLNDVKLHNSFCYHVLVEVCKFLIIFIFINLSMFACIMNFCLIYKKRTGYFFLFAGSQLLNCLFCSLSRALFGKKRNHQTYQKDYFSNKKGPFS